MADGQALQHALRYFAVQVITGEGLDEALGKLCEHATEVFGAVGAGVMLLDEHERLRYVAASDLMVEQADLIQTSMKEGPCWACSSAVEVVSSGDLRVEDRWPRFAEVAVSGGLRSVTCFPLEVGGHCVGTFNVFHDRPREYDEDELEAGRTLAAAAAAHVHNIREYARAEELVDQLHRALRSRVLVEQAKGKLAAQLDLEPDEAFTLLRRTARNRRQRLHDLARGVIEGTDHVDA